MLYGFTLANSLEQWHSAYSDPSVTRRPRWSRHHSLPLTLIEINGSVTLCFVIRVRIWTWGRGHPNFGCPRHLVGTDPDPTARATHQSLRQSHSGGSRSATEQEMRAVQKVVPCEVPASSVQTCVMPGKPSKLCKFTPFIFISSIVRELELDRGHQRNFLSQLNCKPHRVPRPGSRVHTISAWPGHVACIRTIGIQTTL